VSRSRVKTKEKTAPPEGVRTIPPEPLSRRQTLAICASLAAAVLLLYGRSVTHDFVNIDDNMYVTANEHVQAGLSLEGLSWAFTNADTGLWLPVTWLSHLLDCTLFGMRPGLHHLTSVLIHALNGVLLFLVFKKMTGAPVPSLAVAALFAIHPLRVESVAWVAERKDVLSGLFWILTLYAYASYAARPSVRAYVPIIVLFSLGLMSKPMVVTLPCVLLLLDYWPLGRLRISRLGPEPPLKARHTPWYKLLLEKAPLFALSIAVGLVTIHAARSGKALPSLRAMPLDLRVANTLVSYTAYVLSTVWPFGLAVWYPPHVTVPLWPAIGSAAVLLAATVGSLLGARRRPYLLVAWLWFLGTLFPVLGLVQAGEQAYADRFTYLPLVGLYVAAAWAAFELYERRPAWRRPLGWTALALGLALAVTTLVQVGRWKNSATILQHTVDVTDGNYWALANLGAALESAGDTQGAAVQFAEAVRCKPEYSVANANLAVMLQRLGRREEALEHHCAAMRIDPESSQARTNLTTFLQEMETAGPSSQGGVDLAKGYFQLGCADSQAGSYAKAVAWFQKALAARPEFADAHYKLGNVYGLQGNYDEAAKHLAEAVRIDPSHADAHNNYGVVLLGKRDFENGIAQFRAALRAQPGHDLARRNLEVAKARKGKLDSAP
jgi:tetratricopeptide (TPR) repeat protein